jgi:hypothetical protein
MTPNIVYFAFFYPHPLKLSDNAIGLDGRKATEMDWNLAVDINREALKRVLAALVAMAGFADAFTSPLWGGRAEGAGGSELSDKSSTPARQSDDCRPPHKGEVGRLTLHRHLHRAVLRLLRPAEAATRRLVIVAARGIVVAPPPPRSRPRKAKAIPSLFVRKGIGTGIVLPPGMARPSAWLPEANRAKATRSPSFPLFDPVRDPLRRRRPKSSGVPRIRAFDGRDPVFVPVRKPPMPGDPIDATRLGLRLTALGRVLDDLPKQARRFARWRHRVAAGAQKEESRVAAGAQKEESRVAAGAQEQARTANASGFQEKTTGRFHRRWPLKPGLPPGARRPGSRRQAHEIDEILSNTHGLARWVMAHPDTS